MYRALITDLDGTAVKISSNGSDVQESTRLLIQQAQTEGYKVACATGRSWHSAKPVIERLGITSACIIEGGTRIIDPISEQTLWEKDLDIATVREIITILRNYTQDGDLLSTTEKNAPLQKLTRPQSTRIIYLLGIDDSIARAICKEITNRNLAAAHTTISWTGGGTTDVHVTHTEATKEHAIKIWHTLEHVSKSETIGMGDSGNDIPLFKSAGLKIAVANATDDLKSLADYIAPVHNQGSLEHVINKFLFSQHTP